jgi:BirA family biotin operon repressor/biotin-[acetyl-CoA-carboxylase] ligase
MPRDGEPVIHSFDSVSSTQRAARDLLESGRACVGHIVVADQQTAGRGRLGRVWASPPGGLYATFIVRSDRLLALRAGLAAARALEALGVPVRLKWPNDLVVGERKLGGILIEADADVARVGLGINLTSSLLGEATSLLDLGVRADRDALVRAIHAELAREESEAGILDSYRVRSATLGRRVRVDVTAGRMVAGRAVGIDALGRLLVETQDGVDVVSSGDCLHAPIVVD